MEKIPLALTISGFVMFVIEFIRNLMWARNTLPKVRNARQFSASERNTLITEAYLYTKSRYWSRLLSFTLFYVGVSIWLLLTRWNSWEAYAFLAVTIGQFFLVWVTRNHAIIVQRQFEALVPPQAVKRYLDDLEK